MKDVSVLGTAWTRSQDFQAWGIRVGRDATTGLVRRLPRLRNAPASIPAIVTASRLDGKVSRPCAYVNGSGAKRTRYFGRPLFVLAKRDVAGERSFLVHNARRRLGARGQHTGMDAFKVRIVRVVHLRVNIYRRYRTRADPDPHPPSHPTQPCESLLSFSNSDGSSRLGSGGTKP